MKKSPENFGSFFNRPDKNYSKRLPDLFVKYRLDPKQLEQYSKEEDSLELEYLYLIKMLKKTGKQENLVDGLLKMLKMKTGKQENPVDGLLKVLTEMENEPNQEGIDESIALFEYLILNFMPTFDNIISDTTHSPEKLVEDPINQIQNLENVIKNLPNQEDYKQNLETLKLLLMIREYFTNFTKTDHSKLSCTIS